MVKVRAAVGGLSPVRGIAVVCLSHIRYSRSRAHHPALPREVSMKDTCTSRKARDEFDRIVDELLQDPSRAEDIKDRLRTQLGAAPRRPARTVAAEPAEPEDLWENLPV
jgi:hypothetical protein